MWEEEEENKGWKETKRKKGISERSNDDRTKSVE
jgi:hypothetical protein